MSATPCARLAAGGEADELVLGLACVGLAVTAATYATLGAGVPARVGLTAIKAARQTGRGGAALHGDVVHEDRAFVPDAIDVGGFPNHQAAMVDARLHPADVVAHDEEDVGLLLLLLLLLLCDCLRAWAVNATDAPSRPRHRLVFLPMVAPFHMQCKGGQVCAGRASLANRHLKRNAASGVRIGTSLPHPRYRAAQKLGQPA